MNMFDEKKKNFQPLCNCCGLSEIMIFARASKTGDIFIFYTESKKIGGKNKNQTNLEKY